MLSCVSTEMSLPSVLPHSMGVQLPTWLLQGKQRGSLSTTLSSERQEKQAFYPESTLHKQHQHYSHFSFWVLQQFSPGSIKDSVRSTKSIPDQMFYDNILGLLIAPSKHCIKTQHRHTVGTLMNKQTLHPPKRTCDPKVQF